jgi:ankyrin repeat protein
MAAFVGDVDRFHTLRSDKADSAAPEANCPSTALIMTLSPYIAEPGTPEQQEQERSKRKLRIADELIATCQEVTATDALGATALHFAVTAYYPAATVLSLTRRLIDCGAAVDAPTKRGITPLMRAVLARRPDVVRLLLTAGANPLLPAQDGESALEIAERTGQREVAAVLRQALRDGGR